MAGSLIGSSSLIARLFEYRSGRTLALSRLALIALFAIALWFDPVQPLRVPPPIVAGLAVYAVLAVVMLVVAWRSWWFERALAGPAFAADALAFYAAMPMTQGLGDDFFSPFIVFYAFMLIAASIRWGWRTTLLLGLGLSAAFAAAGVIIDGAGIELDPVRIVRRAVYMVFLGAAVAWFAAQYVGRSYRPRVPFPATDASSMLDEALHWAMACTGATGGAIAWADTEEPRAQLRTAALTAPRVKALSPDELDLDQPANPALFDTAKGRALFLTDEATIALQSKGLMPDLARLCDVDNGMVVPLRGSTGNGQLLLTGIAGTSVDHLRLAATLGEECALAADRAQLASVHEQATLVRMRNAVARDLHDSVAQSLAGASFRLSALASVIETAQPGASDVVSAIGEVRSSIAAEQAHVRDMIERLRQEEITAGMRDLSTDLAVLGAQLARHWNVAIEADIEPDATVPAMVALEVQNLAREAVANAVRHGRAHRIDLALERGRSGLMLTVADDGIGFANGDAQPRSLTERVEALGGTLVISTRPDDTRVVITLPTGPQ